MTAGTRMAVIGLAAFGAVAVIATLAVPVFARRWATGSAALRARRLATLRLLPTVVALAASTVVWAAFLLFEPRWEGEDIGVLTPALAALATALLGGAAGRSALLVLSTQRTFRSWLRTAEPVSLQGISAPAFAVSADFPIVAVIGLRRPRLIIARSVLASCTDEELQAVLAHEQGHIDRRDNLRRLLLSVAPDILTWLPHSERLFAAWRDAAEEAADDDAARSGVDGRLRLASALIKVARLTPGAPSPRLMPASALYRGESLDRRVRRLLEPGDTAAMPISSPWPVRAAAGVVALVAVSALQDVHHLVEQLIHILP